MSRTETTHSSSGGLATPCTSSNEEDGQGNKEPEEPIDPRTLLTPEQVKDFKAIFSDFDPENTGKIPVKLLGDIIRRLGYNPTKADIRRYMAETSPDSKGMMSFPGFLLPISEIIQTEPETLEDILMAFRILDESAQGFLQTSEISSYLSTLGESLEDFELDLFIKMADPKGEGKIVYDEFLDRMMGPPKKSKKKPKNK